MALNGLIFRSALSVHLLPISIIFILKISDPHKFSFAFYLQREKIIIKSLPLSFFLPHLFLSLSPYFLLLSLSLLPILLLLSFYYSFISLSYDFISIFLFKVKLFFSPFFLWFYILHLMFHGFFPKLRVFPFFAGTDAASQEKFPYQYRSKLCMLIVEYTIPIYVCTFL